MPSRDANGKELGGAEKARRKRAKIEVLRRARMAERKRLGLPGLDFSDLPPPPYGEPLRVVGWCLDVLLVCADRVLRDEFMPFARKLRLLIDIIKRAGMLRDAAIEQRQILEILTRLDKKRAADGMEPYKPGPIPRIPRPAS